MKRCNTELSTLTVGSFVNAKPQKNVENIKEDSRELLDNQDIKKKRKSRLLFDTNSKRSSCKPLESSLNVSTEKINNITISNEIRDASCSQINQVIPHRGRQIDKHITSYKKKYKSANALGRVLHEGSAWVLQQTPITFKDFEVIEELGKGKFGKVIKVRRKLNGDIFAVKLIQIKTKLGKRDEENLNSEAEIFKTTSDTFVVKAYYW